MIRIFIVDDHTVLREGLRLLLAGVPGLVVVGEAVQGQHLLDQLPTTPADVVLLDLNMPVLGGIATARQLREHHPDLRVLMLSMVDEPLSIGEAFAAGAHGYILKIADKGEILVGIQTVAGGRRFLCSEVGLSLLKTVLQGRPPDPRPAFASPLSRREQEILVLVSEGLTTAQIADQLFTSKRTVETHRQNILAKTGCKNTAALINWASTNHLLDTPKEAAA